MNEMKMKPFNLEDALAGKPVVGVPVTEIHKFNSSNDSQTLFAVVDGFVFGYYDNGKYNLIDEESNWDLFMKPEFEKKFVAYNKKTGEIIPYCIERDDEQFDYYSKHSEYQIVEFDAEI